MTAHRYESELSQRAMQRARRRVMAEPEPQYDDPRIPAVRLLNIVLSVLFLEAMVAAWALPHLYRWAVGA